MEIDLLYMRDHIPLFVKSAIITLQIAFLGIFFSLLVGVINNCIYFFKLKTLSFVVRIYVELSRNTPLLVQLFFLYFALPTLGIKLSSFSTAVIGLTFLGGSYITETFRSGMEAVSNGQVEAGLSIGLSRVQILRYVIVPQAITISIPALIANGIFLLKETSVVSAIAVHELLYATTSLIAIDYKTAEALILLTLSYVIIFLPLSLILTLVERRMKCGQYGN
ncbi:amino acid ABC transporter permease [Clostridium hydrogeniformans]|uniref:amino acid ABC transporter permease n=1 Tax=Clostridium hydrogeniformans TaxID=349933 RepID=UPI0004876232|nr:amino acid ABC transporter permease [Clostridium hydrogeniformans]